MKQIIKKLSLLLLLYIFPHVLIQAQTVSPQVESAIKNELDVAFGKSIQAAEKLDADQLNMHVDDSRKAGFIINGIFYADFEDVIANFKSGIQGIASQKIRVLNKRITVLTESLGIITATGENEVFTVSGGSFAVKFAWSFVYEKTGNGWKVIQSHQSATQ